MRHRCASVFFLQSLVLCVIGGSSGGYNGRSRAVGPVVGARGIACVAWPRCPFDEECRAESCVGKSIRRAGLSCRYASTTLVVQMNLRGGSQSVDKTRPSHYCLRVFAGMFLCKIRGGHTGIILQCVLSIHAFQEELLVGSMMLMTGERNH